MKNAQSSSQQLKEHIKGIINKWTSAGAINLSHHSQICILSLPFIDYEIETADVQALGGSLDHNCPPQTGLHKGAHRHHLTRLGVAEDRWTAAEGGTAAVITTAATAAAQAAPPSSKRHLYLFRGTHWETEGHRETLGRRQTGDGEGKSQRGKQ